MTALEETKAQVLAEIERYKSRGDKGINTFACICGEDGKVNKVLYREAILEYCTLNDIDRDKFTTYVTRFLLRESFTIWVDTDMWSSVNARCEDNESEYKDLKFHMQCDLLDHGYLFLILAFKDTIPDSD